MSTMPAERAGSPADSCDIVWREPWGSHVMVLDKNGVTEQMPTRMRPHSSPS